MSQVDPSLRRLLPKEAELLGPLERCCPTLAPYRFRYVLGGVVVLLLGLLISCVFCVIPFPGSFTGSPMVALLAFGLALPLGVYAIVSGALQRGVTCLLFRDGLVKIEQDQAILVRWTELKDVWVSKHVDDAGFRLTTIDNRELSVDRQVANAAVLGSKIQAHATDVHLPQARDNIRDGATVWFAQLGISSAGLAYKTTTIGWDDIQELVLGPNDFLDEVFEVKQKGTAGTWCCVATRALPNFHLFATLLNELRPKEEH